MRDVQEGGSLASDKAYVAGRIAFAGTPIAPSLHITAAGGKDYVVRPERELFVVEMPAGDYALRRFGSYILVNDRLAFSAVRGRISYVGDFLPARDSEGRLRMLVRDARDAAGKEISGRHGTGIPFEPALVRSSLVPLPGAEKELVVELEEIVMPPPYYYYDPWRYTYWYRWRSCPRPHPRGH